MNPRRTSAGRAKPPGEPYCRSNRRAAADSSTLRELWVQAGNVCEPRRGDRSFSSAPPVLVPFAHSTPGSRPGLLSSAPPVLRRPAPSSITGRAKPPGEPPHGPLLTIQHLAGSLRSTGANSGRARHSVRAAESPGVPDAMGLRRRAEDCPPYLLRSHSGENPTSTGKRTLKPSERGLSGRSGRNRSEAVRRFLAQTAAWTRCGPEGRAPKTPPDHPVPHPFHPRDPWAVLNFPFPASCSFVSIVG